MDQGEGGDKRGVRGSALVAGLVPKDQEFARTDQYGCPLHVDLPPSPPARSVSLSLCFHLASLLWAACLLLFLSLPPSPSLPLACSPLLLFPPAILITLFLPRKLYVTPHAFYPYSSCFPHQFLSLFHSRSFPLPRSRERIQLVLPTYVHPRFHPRVRNDRRRFLFAFVSPRGIFLSRAFS